MISAASFSIETLAVSPLGAAPPADMAATGFAGLLMAATAPATLATVPAGGATAPAGLANASPAAATPALEPAAIVEFAQAVAAALELETRPVPRPGDAATRLPAKPDLSGRDSQPSRQRDTLLPRERDTLLSRQRDTSSVVAAVTSETGRGRPVGGRQTAMPDPENLIVPGEPLSGAGGDLEPGVGDDAAIDLTALPEPGEKAREVVVQNVAGQTMAGQNMAMPDMAALETAAPATTVGATVIQAMALPLQANPQSPRAPQPAPVPQPVAALAPPLRMSPAAVGAGATASPAAPAGQSAAIAERRIAEVADSVPPAAPAGADATTPEAFVGTAPTASRPASASLVLALRPGAPAGAVPAAPAGAVQNAPAGAVPADGRAGQLRVQSAAATAPVPNRLAMADPAEKIPAARTVSAAARQLASADEAVVAGQPLMTAPAAEPARAVSPLVPSQQAQPQQAPQQVDIETPALGPVTIALERSDGALRVHFTVDRGAAAQALLESAALLDRSLATTGTRLDQFSVDVRGGQPGMTANIDSGGERQPGRDPRQPLPQHEPPAVRDVPERARRIATLDRFA